MSNNLTTKRIDLKFYLYERLFEKAELNLISNNRATKVEDVEDDG